MPAQLPSSISSIGPGAARQRRQRVLEAGGHRPAGDVDQEAHVAHLAADAIGEVGDRGGLGQVHDERAHGLVPELAREPRQAGLVHVGHGHPDALAGEPVDHGLPDAAGGTRHDPDPAVESAQVHQAE